MNKNTTFIITGFNEFGHFDVNISKQLVYIIENTRHNFGKKTIIPLTVPTEFAASEECIRYAINNISPDIIISFGLGFENETITVETTARNIDNTCSRNHTITDNSGEIRNGSKIIESGPDTYMSTINYTQIYHAARKAGLTVKLSDNAGSFVCNHLFYYTSHIIAKYGGKIRNGFFHIPPLKHDAARWGLETQGCSMDELMTALNIILEYSQ